MKEKDKKCIIVLLLIITAILNIYNLLELTRILYLVKDQSDIQVNIASRLNKLESDYYFEQIMKGE